MRNNFLSSTGFVVVVILYCAASRVEKKRKVWIVKRKSSAELFNFTPSPRGRGSDWRSWSKGGFLIEEELSGGIRDTIRCREIHVSSISSLKNLIQYRYKRILFNYSFILISRYNTPQIIIVKHHTRFLIEISSFVAIHRFKNQYLSQTGSVAIETFQSSTPGIPQALGNSSRRPATSIPPSRYPLFPENEILWSLAPRTWSLDELPLISSTLSHLPLSLSLLKRIRLSNA